MELASDSRRLGSPLLATLAMLLALVAGAGVLFGLEHSPAARPNVHNPAARHGFARLPMELRSLVSEKLGRELGAYRTRPIREGFGVGDSAQGLQARFSPSGVSIASSGTRFGLSLRAIGFGDSLMGVGPASLSARGNRVTYARGALSEWYADGPLGLEQGFTIPHAPAGLPAGPLTIALALSGNVHATLDGGAQGVTLARHGEAPLRYKALSVRDATGRVLGAWMSLQRGRILLHANTRHARYPLYVDPLIQQGEKLTGGGESEDAQFGISVALSADGDTALIGGPHDSSSLGAAWVFTRSEGKWSQQGEKLTADDESGTAVFGWRVALSADGNTALIGGPDDGFARTGAAWVFTRTGGKWSQQGQKLTGAGETGNDGWFGYSVALSSDGNTALIGGSGDNFDAGSAWVFTRSSGTWSQQGEKLTGSGESGAAFFGETVDLSADGNTAIIGGPGDDASQGAAWMFTRSGGAWSQQGEKLTADDESGKDAFGHSVALSSDGNTAATGDFANQSGRTGAVWIFTRSGENWSQQGGKLTAKGESGPATFGVSVALSSDGNTLLIGGDDDGFAVGAAWIFARSEGAWSQQGEKLITDDEAGNGAFGSSVALSADAHTALIGGSDDSAEIGAAWVFTGNPLWASVAGTVTDEASKPVAGAIVSVCESGPGPERCFRESTRNDGSYGPLSVPVGTLEAWVSPPSDSPYDAAYSGIFTVEGPATQNFTLTRATPPPDETEVTGMKTTMIGEDEVPVLSAGSESPISTHACVGGTVKATLTVAGTALAPVTLTEGPSGSGTFVGLLPAAHLLHGLGSVVMEVTDCPSPSQDHTFEFTIYVDPSGTVVDGSNGDVPIAGATVTLLTGEGPGGPFESVANGSAVMSPANRTNPDTTNANGEFGWDTVGGYYEVTASKAHCGTATTSAFQVPPPQTNLQIVLHCPTGLHVTSGALPAATRGTSYSYQLEASGGKAPYKWAKAGPLPKGLKLGKTGVLSGSPKSKLAPGNYPVNVKVKDAAKPKATASETLTLRIR